MSPSDTLSASLQTELLALAWSALSWGWAERWTFIVLAGSGPVLLMKVSAWWARHPMSDLVRRVGALTAVVLCLYSGYLLADTVMVDDRGIGALRTERCEAIERQDSMLVAQCDGKRVRAPALGTAEPLGPVTAYRLPYSGELLAFTPAD